MNTPAQRTHLDWSHLNHLQLGRYSEYLAKMEFTRFGYDVYTAEVDDKGIDFVVRQSGERYFDVQVKSCRDYNYVCFRKDKFEIRPNLWAVVLTFTDGEAPKVYLIPSSTWNKPNELFVSRDFEGKKSKPEWGLNLSKKNLSMLDKYQFDKMVEAL